MKSTRPLNRVRARAATQCGVVLLFCLIVLLILVASGIAIVRSMNTSMTNSGNLAFRRDLMNQGEQAVAKAMQAFGSGGALSDTSTIARSQPSLNYSATELETNERGIPKLLLQTTDSPKGRDVAGNNFAPTAGDLKGRSDDVRIRFVVDRLCNASGSFSAIGTSGCITSPIDTTTGGTLGEDRPPSSSPPMYRVSVRVSGPRDTQVFLQASFSKPE